MPSNDWIFSPEAQQHLQQIVTRRTSGDPMLSIAKKLRLVLPPTRANQLMELDELRERGKTKFTNAEKMFFTRTQLEQATSETVSRYKAKRFKDCQHVVDLCCGIGGDAIGLGTVTKLHLVDLDPVVLEMARRNLQIYGYQAITECARVENYDVSAMDAFHLDPDRRIPLLKQGKQRTVNADHFSPNRREIEGLIGSNPNFAIKLAPASEFRAGDFEVEFIGHQRECKQQIIWSGNLHSESGTRVTVLENSGNESESFFASSNRVAIPSPAPSLDFPRARFVYDPHSALLSSGLLAEFADQSSLFLLDRTSRYLYAERAFHSRLVSCFQIEDILKPDIKIIQQYLNHRNVGVLEIKKRGNREDLKNRLHGIKLRGERSMTLMLTDTPIGFRAIACQRLHPLSRENQTES